MSSQFIFHLKSHPLELAFILTGVDCGLSFDVTEMRAFEIPATDGSGLRKAQQDAIPEFMRFNIAEREARECF